MNDAIPADLKAVFADTSDLEALFANLMPVYGKAVCAERSLLFLYEPDRKMARCIAAWQAKPEWAMGRDMNAWEAMPDDLPEQDPMFAEAMVNPEALYIDDVLNAPPEVLNGPYEVEHFRHLALVHAPLLEDGKLWGILEPCTMAAPRAWTDHDKAITAWTQAQLLPLAKRYIAQVFS
jgi:GAF domain-containing protein